MHHAGWIWHNEKFDEVLRLMLIVISVRLQKIEHQEIRMLYSYLILPALNAGATAFLTAFQCSLVCPVSIFSPPRNCRWIGKL